MFRIAACLALSFNSWASTDAAQGAAIDEISVVHAVNLQKDAHSADEKNLPILLAFSTPWCTYCEAMEQEVLEPLLRSGDYTDKMILRKLEVTDNNQLIGFDGKRVASDRLARRYDIDVYPTLVFINAKGDEVGQRIVGISLLDYIFADIDTALAVASQRGRDPASNISRDISSEQL